MKKITGLLVNPTAGSVEKTTITKSLDSYHAALGCNYIDIVSRRIGDHHVEIICDDEGLLTENPRPSATDAKGRPCLYGSLFICAFDGVEDVTSLPDDVIADILAHHVRTVFGYYGAWSVIYPCNY